MSVALVGHLSEPLIWLLGLGFGLGSLLPSISGMSYLQFLSAGMLCNGVMNSASYEGLSAAFLRWKIRKNWDAILNAPMSVSDVVIGEWLWAAVKGGISGAAIALVMLALGVLKPQLVLLAVPLIILIGLVFASMGLIVTALTESEDLHNYYFSWVLMPMMVISGVFFPAEQLPQALQFLAQLMPLMHATELARGLVVGAAPAHAVLNLGVLAVYALGGLAVAVKLINARATR